MRIVHCGDLGQPTLTDKQLDAIGNVDVLFIPVGGVYTVDGNQAADIARQVYPRIVVPIHYKTSNLVYDLQPVQGFLAALGNDFEVVWANGNTLVVSAGKRGTAKPQAIVFNFLPWQLSTKWKKLFEAKEKACRASQQVFAKLSAE